MGLDTVELMIEVEKEFDIKIPDSEAVQIITVHDFQECVWRHLKNRQSEKCMTQKTFYILRKGLIETFQIPQKDLQMDTLMESIFPFENRRKIYETFSQKYQLQLPSLKLDTATQNIFDFIFVSSVILSTLISFILVYFYNYSAWIYLSIVATFIFMGIISRLLQPWRKHFEPSRLKAFTQKVFTLNYRKSKHDNMLNKYEVALLLQQLIADKSGFELEEITADKKLCDDLGLN